jgi:hypothetical protein
MSPPPGAGALGEGELPRSSDGLDAVGAADAVVSWLRNEGVAVGETVRPGSDDPASATGSWGSDEGRCAATSGRELGGAFTIGATNAATTMNGRRRTDPNTSNGATWPSRRRADDRIGLAPRRQG